MIFAVYFLSIVYAGALAAPEDPTTSIDDLEQSFFFSNTRIVGGQYATEGSVPWMAGLSTGYVLRSFVCGASIATEWHIITAAHCVEAVYNRGLINGGSLVSSLRVHVGSNRWNSGDTRYSLAGNLTHPNYVSNTIKNDIGVLITDKPIVFSHLVQPVALNFHHVPGGAEVMVAGWGRVRAGGSLASNLKNAFLAVLDGHECVARVLDFSAKNNYIGVPPVEPHIEICTFHSVGKGTCNGDSGSALVLAGSKQQIGIVSWGFPCAVGAPDMFASVSGGKIFLKKALTMMV